MLNQETRNPWVLLGTLCLRTPAIFHYLCPCRPRSSRVLTHTAPSPQKRVHEQVQKLHGVSHGKQLFADFILCWGFQPPSTNQKSAILFRYIYIYIPHIVSLLPHHQTSTDLCEQGTASSMNRSSFTCCTCFRQFPVAANSETGGFAKKDTHDQ